ncbi:MAG TPA: hypothetical protein VFB60_08035 [Ktedonobacteraceae bacterium]|nr:hypothetical protein [Ktedonobacteraceae bacterium]
MKFTAYIMVDRPPEKVFDWMFQPQHIVQLVTRKPPQDLINSGHVPAHLSERVAKQRLLQEEAEIAIEIKDLSTPTLQVGTTFYYSMGLQYRSTESPDWKYLTSGTITIKKSTPPTSFTFATKGFSLSAEHHLAFQARHEGTIITYHQSIPFGKLQLKIASIMAPGSFQTVLFRKGAVPFGNEEVQQQLQHLKAHMKAEID